MQKYIFKMEIGLLHTFSATVVRKLCIQTYKIYDIHSRKVCLLSRLVFSTPVGKTYFRIESYVYTLLTAICYMFVATVLIDLCSYVRNRYIAIESCHHALHGPIKEWRDVLVTCGTQESVSFEFNSTVHSLVSAMYSKNVSGTSARGMQTHVLHLVEP